MRKSQGHFLEAFFFWLRNWIRHIFLYAVYGSFVCLLANSNGNVETQKNDKDNAGDDERKPHAEDKRVWRVNGIVIHGVTEDVVDASKK